MSFEMKEFFFKRKNTFTYIKKGKKEE